MIKTIKTYLIIFKPTKQKFKFLIPFYLGLWVLWFLITACTIVIGTSLPQSFEKMTWVGIIFFSLGYTSRIIFAGTWLIKWINTNFLSEINQSGLMEFNHPVSIFLTEFRYVFDLIWAYILLSFIFHFRDKSKSEM